MVLKLAIAFAEPRAPSGRGKGLALKQFPPKRQQSLSQGSYGNSVRPVHCHRRDAKHLGNRPKIPSLDGLICMRMPQPIPGTHDLPLSFG